MIPISDETLAQQAQAGDMTAFEELVFRYETRVYRFLANSCRNQTDASDLCQETFVAAFRNLKKFDSTKSFCTWLFTIARRKSIDHHRSHRPQRGEALPEIADTNDPASLFARQQREKDLWKLARGILPGNQFQALWLKYAEDMTVQEIARVMQKTLTHIKVLLFRARKSLAREIEMREADGAIVKTEKHFLSRQSFQT